MQNLYHHFEPVIVEIDALLDDPKKANKAFLYNVKEWKGVRPHYPLHLEASYKQQYFEAEKKFDPVAMLKSPTILMVAAPIVMMWMMKQMPKPDKEQMEEMQKMTGG